MYDYTAKFVKAIHGNKVVLSFDVGFGRHIDEDVYLFLNNTGPCTEDAKLFVELWFTANEEVYATVHKENGRHFATIYPYLYGLRAVLGASLQSDMLDAGLA